MRTFLVPVITTLSMAMVLPALALQAEDSMRVWKNTPSKERNELLEQILGKEQAGRASVLKCMDETSTTPGHSDLPIGEVAKVCATAGKSEQPV